MRTGKDLKSWKNLEKPPYFSWPLLAGLLLQATFWSSGALLKLSPQKTPPLTTPTKHVSCDDSPPLPFIGCTQAELPEVPCRWRVLVRGVGYIAGLGLMMPVSARPAKSLRFMCIT